MGLEGLRFSMVVQRDAWLIPLASWAGVVQAHLALEALEKRCGEAMQGAAQLVPACSCTSQTGPGRTVVLTELLHALKLQAAFRKPGREHRQCWEGAQSVLPEIHVSSYWCCMPLPPHRVSLWLSKTLPLHVNRPDPGGRAYLRVLLCASVLNPGDIKLACDFTFLRASQQKPPAGSHRKKGENEHRLMHGTFSPPKKIRERKQDRSNLFLFLEGVIGTCLSWDHKDTLLAVYIPSH